MNDGVQVHDEVVQRLKAAYQQLMSRIGDPLDDDVLLGPLHTKPAMQMYLAAIQEAKSSGGTIECGGKVSVYIASLQTQPIICRFWSL